jgi:predicted aspartyl protease
MAFLKFLVLLSTGLNLFSAYGMVTKPISYSNNMPIIELKIYGKTRKFLLDTRAGTLFIAIDPAILQQQSKLPKPKTRKSMNILSKIFIHKYYELKNFEVDGIMVKDVKIEEWQDWSASQGDESLKEKLEIDGIIGLEFLKTFNGVLDFKEHKYIILNEKEISAYRKNKKNNSTIVPFKLTKDGITLEIKFCPNCKFVNFILDTGAGDGVIDTKLAHNYFQRPIKSQSIKVAPGKISYGAEDLYVKNVKLASLSEIALLDNIPVNIIGMSVLKNRKMFVDFTNNQIFLDE